SMAKMLAEERRPEERRPLVREPLLASWPQPLGAEPAGLPLKKLLTAVFRLRWSVFGAMALGALVGGGLAVTTPNTYLRQGTVLVTSGAENIQIDLTRTTETKAETLAAAAIYMLKTDTLLQRVAERVTPERILSPYQPEAGGTGVGAVLHGLQRWNAG